MTAKNFCVLGVLLVIGAFAAAYPGKDPDAFIHLSAGRQVVENGGPVRVESLTALSGGKPFVNHEWLYDAAVFGLTEIVGTDVGVSLFRMLLAGLLLLLSYLAATMLGADRRVALAVVIMFLPLFRSELDLRPHVAGYALMALQLAVVARDVRYGGVDRSYRSALSTAALLVLSSMLWANVHGSFPLATILCLFWVVSAADKSSVRWYRFAVSLLVCAAFLVNPWGPRLLETVLHHGEPAYRTLVPEWGSYPWAEKPARDISMMVLVLAGLLSFLPRINRRRLPELFMFLLFLGMALTSIKFLLGLAVVCVPLLAANLSRSFEHLGKRSFMFAGAALCAIQWVFIPPALSRGIGFDLDNYPADSLSDVRREAISGVVFAPFHQGGFIEWTRVPGLKPFIDGRAYVHGLEGISTYVSALREYGQFIKLHRSHHFDAVLVELSDPAFPRLASALGSDPGWELISLDSRFAVFVPSGSPRKGAGEPFRYLKATNDPRYLFELPLTDIAPAVAEAERVMARDGGMEAGLLSRGVLRLHASGLSWDPDLFGSWAGEQGKGHLNEFDRRQKPGYCDEASNDFSRLILIRPDVPMFRYFLGLATVCGGRCSDALALLEDVRIPEARVLSTEIHKICR